MKNPWAAVDYPLHAAIVVCELGLKPEGELAAVGRFIHDLYCYYSFFYLQIKTTKTQKVFGDGFYVVPSTPKGPNVRFTERLYGMF
jgi:hypothetical protein